MARCPKLDFDGDHAFYSDCWFICTLTGVRMDPYDIKVKSLCKTEYGEQYRDCPIYKNS